MIAPPRARIGASLALVVLAAGSLGCASIAGLEDGVLTSSSAGSGGAAGTGGGGAGGASGTGGHAHGGGGATSGGGGSAPSYRDEVLADMPLDYWRFDESDPPTAADLGSGHHDGTYLGSLTLGAPGALLNDPDTAVTFSGGSVDMGAILDLAGTQPFAIEFWMNGTSTGGCLIAKATYDTMNGYAGYMVNQHPSSNVLNYDRIGQGSDSVNVPEPASGSYTYVVVNYDGFTLRMYTDANEIDNQPGGAMLNVNTAHFLVGAFGPWGTYRGSLDELAVYDHPLPVARIAAHYHASGR
jgi:hypothetical protein